MPLTIPDRVLDELRMHAPATLVELACRLYEADAIEKPQATKLAGLSRTEFEGELTKRGLPWIRINYDETYAREFEELKDELSARAKQGD
jgi:predicted HTH domain antitoxin